MRRRAALKSCVIVQVSALRLRLERLTCGCCGTGSRRLLRALAEELFHHACRLAGVVRFALNPLARFDAVDETRLRHFAKTLLVEAHRDGRLRGEFCGDFECLVEHLVFVDEVMNEADAM